MDRWIDEGMDREICCALCITLFIIMLFIQGHITMAHTLQAVWFLKGPLHIESNQVKQSQHNLMGNVAPPDRQKDAVIILAHHRVFCMATKIHSITQTELTKYADKCYCWFEYKSRWNWLWNGIHSNHFIREAFEFTASFWFIVLLDVAILLYN